MLDLKYIVENRDHVIQSHINKGYNADAVTKTVNDIIDLYNSKKSAQAELDQKRHELKKASEEFAKYSKEGKDTGPLKEQNLKLREEIKELEQRFNGVDYELNPKHYELANIPHENIPVGKDNTFNRVIREPIKPKEFKFKPKDHIELTRKLGIIDWERQAKLAGSNFVLLKGKGAKLQRSLINFMVDQHRQNGYEEYHPPYIASEQTMFNSAHLPKFREEMYELTRSDGFLIPTAEVPLVSIFSNEILNCDELPKYIVAHTPCFRREAGAYGTETRGMVRIHQFDKVELVKLTHPDNSYSELESLVKSAESILQALDIPYRVILLSTGEMSLASSMTYDIETWGPGVNRWLETSSCSNCTDFQARRAKIRFRDRDKKVKIVHTLNGSGVALPRLIISLIENHQNEDGAINIPEPLWDYTGFKIMEHTKS